MGGVPRFAVISALTDHTAHHRATGGTDDEAALGVPGAGRAGGGHCGHAAERLGTLGCGRGAAGYTKVHKVHVPRARSGDWERIVETLRSPQQRVRITLADELDRRYVPQQTHGANVTLVGVGERWGIDPDRDLRKAA